MCGHCGCSSDKARLSAPWAPPALELKLDEGSLKLHQALLSGNDALAADNRRWLAEHRIHCVNLMGTPGAGKTTLLEATFKGAPQDWPHMAVLEGDQQTQNDARRIHAAGGQALQINTGTGCHLDAEMIKAGLDTLAPKPGSLLFVENVGNLVCPALFDLGETRRVAMMAVTDGEDKPEKYPHLFASCELVILNKCDLLPHLDFDLDKVKQGLDRLNPRTRLLQLSARTGQGLDAWFAWLAEGRHG
ncbi:hydrogenase nickel incorporation protein HypB [Gallaecimonas kandeliae]|uniref:hydrogenase nickel incorporation protein HypB n=1 Tax=Gallaecimonas kandeliae TaxID=3029055 RepID=UPI0026495AA6|nr:hydrogenase nickel incorporation protein HypB [Gallaecimonas kandeliae]WKE64210.1 hydrogenase nickel incorporation protein HypB [Gallaecimonas kandeliae]